MNGPSPTVRYLIACEDIQADPNNPHRISLVNVVSTIRSQGQPPYPLLFRELCVFVQLTECRGDADVEIRVVHADTGRFAYPGPLSPWKAALPNDPLAVVGLPFRIRDLDFEESGLYWIQFWYDGAVLAQQPLLLR
jgi:hypothetical protein